MHSSNVRWAEVLWTDTVTQAQLLLRDLKIAQCKFTFCFLDEFNSPLADTKLPPRAAFTAQIIGTLLGAVLNYGKENKAVVRVANRSRSCSVDELCH